ncbi:MAG: Gfo/Idh/MocA family oxidoreductase [Bacteroidales bacterium]|nr:Gfo/Idh/MocA family oxidoreductase [Bacteroidales bacterium]
MKRRTFIRNAALAGAALSFPSALRSSVSEKEVRIGLIGLGLRGRDHLNNLLSRKDVDICAICDVDPQAVQIAKNMIEEAGRKVPKIFCRDDYAYRALLDLEEPEGIIISTPWLWHTRMSVDTMNAGKYAGVEVSAATTIEECWDLVNTYERTGVPLMILENVCYRRDVMAVLQMVREGLFGELLHARCGYQHDLRNVKFNDGLTPYGNGVEFGEKGFSEAVWRTFHSMYRNGDLYPTHGAGPVATIFNINRGNRFLSITSTATKSRGLKDYILNHPKGGPDHPNSNIEWKLGDIVTSTISTARGESILVTHDCNLPRPYSLGFRVQGLKGLAEFDHHTQRIYIEGISPSDTWEQMDPYLKKYDHPLWKKYGEVASETGHGGMDFFIDHAFVEIVKGRMEAPLDAYDAAAWSAITPLSEKSIQNNGEPQEFPDFTRGRWINRKPVFALNDDF